MREEVEHSRRKISLFFFWYCWKRVLRNFRATTYG